MNIMRRIARLKYEYSNDDGEKFYRIVSHPRTGKKNKIMTKEIFPERKAQELVIHMRRTFQF
jgi:hypothetical protein